MVVRRRLKLNYSSDEEEEEECHQSSLLPQQHQHDDIEEVEIDDVHVRNFTAGLNTVTLTSPDAIATPNCNSNPNTGEPYPIDISDDDDIIDATIDDFIDTNTREPNPSFDRNTGESTLPSPNPTNYFHTPSAHSSGASVVDELNCPIIHYLQRLGLSLSREWFDSCIRTHESSVPGFGSFDVARKAKICFQSFLFSDMNYCGGGMLPENVASMHLVVLAGPFVLQVDEIVNISCPLRGRYQNAASGLKRCLKLCMTDGVQRVFGMEYRPIKDLEVLAPSGLKVLICNVNIRHGLFLLVPETIEVLGGSVDELDAARQRLVQEINKPPRGKRTRNGLLPPLATRATLAAWPRNGSNIPDNSDNFVTPSTNSTRENRQSASMATPAMEPIFEEHIVVPTAGENVVNNVTSAVVDDEDIEMLDEAELPFILRGDKENPFTYLASLSTTWAAMKGETPFVKGTIKCNLTGVKGFQFKKRDTFDLRVYVDDGSLISEIFIDHNVIQNEIGYSPKEVTTALSSIDEKVASNMRGTMKRFQNILANFEGTMLIEMNETSPLPIALEMNQGFSTSYAWSLFGRH